MHTPWGMSDYRKEFAPGVVFYATPSHGGFKLSPERNALIRDEWRLDDAWYEEDCDANFVAATFPELFPHLKQDEVEEAIAWVIEYRATHPVVSYTL